MTLDPDWPMLRAHTQCSRKKSTTVHETKSQECGRLVSSNTRVTRSSRLYPRSLQQKSLSRQGPIYVAHDVDWHSGIVLWFLFSSHLVLSPSCLKSWRYRLSTLCTASVLRPSSLAPYPYLFMETSHRFVQGGVVSHSNLRQFGVYPTGRHFLFSTTSKPRNSVPVGPK